MQIAVVRLAQSKAKRGTFVLAFLLASAYIAENLFQLRKINLIPSK